VYYVGTVTCIVQKLDKHFHKCFPIDSKSIKALNNDPTCAARISQVTAILLLLLLSKFLVLKYVLMPTCDQLCGTSRHVSCPSVSGEDVTASAYHARPNLGFLPAGNHSFS